MSNSLPDVLIAGASARAAAFSAIRGGLVVAATDLFADRDLIAVANATKIADWPIDIESWAAQFPSSVPLIYTGGLENHPALLDRIAQRRPLAGIAGEPLAKCRSPESLLEILSAHHVAVASLRSTPDPRDREWLVKPRRGGGGRGIRRLTSETEFCASEQYVQQFIEGTAGSAAFLARADGSARLIGLCESLRGLDFHADPFAYYGSVVRSDWTSEMLARAGEVLAEIGLRGVFGIDFIRQDNGQDVVIEVNPRFTASMELHELSSGCSLMGEHLDLFGVRPRGLKPNVATGRRETVFGKRIVYAPQSLTCDFGEPPTLEGVRQGTYTLADLPQPGITVAAGMPICTVIAGANDFETCRMTLENMERTLLAKCELSSR